MGEWIGRIIDKGRMLIGRIIDKGRMLIGRIIDKGRMLIRPYRGLRMDLIIHIFSYDL
jgi:hypothetical protein